MAWIERRIGRQIPDQPDPVLAARLYSSLREIPLHAVGAREIDVLTQVDGKQRLTVYDILTRPREDLFRPAQRLAGTDGERMALSELEEEYYQKLYTKIAAYAERFNTAKLRQRPSED